MQIDTVWIWRSTGWRSRPVFPCFCNKQANRSMETAGWLETKRHPVGLFTLCCQDGFRSQDRALLTRIDRIANTLRRTLFKPHLIHFGFTPAGTCRGITCFCFCFFLPRLGFYNLFLIPWFLCLCMWWRFFLGHVFAYGPKTGPTCLFIFCVVICWGEGGGVGGAVITSCVYVIIDFLRWTHFMLRYTLRLRFGDKS